VLLARSLRSVTDETDINTAWRRLAAERRLSVCSCGNAKIAGWGMQGCGSLSCTADGVWEFHRKVKVRAAKPRVRFERNPCGKSGSPSAASRAGYGQGLHLGVVTHLQPLYAEARGQLGAQPQAGAQPHGEQARLMIVQLKHLDGAAVVDLRELGLRSGLRSGSTSGSRQWV